MPVSLTTQAAGLASALVGLDPGAAGKVASDARPIHVSSVTSPDGSGKRAGGSPTGLGGAGTVHLGSVPADVDEIVSPVRRHNSGRARDALIPSVNSAHGCEVVRGALHTAGLAGNAAGNGVNA